MDKGGRAISVVFGIIALIAAYAIKGVSVYNKKQNRLMQEASRDYEYKKWQQEREKERQQEQLLEELLKEHTNTSEAEEQLEHWLERFVEIVNSLENNEDMSDEEVEEAAEELKETVEMLHKWIPKYRAELKDMRANALSENDKSTLERCDENLEYLEELEEALEGFEKEVGWAD